MWLVFLNTTAFWRLLIFHSLGSCARKVVVYGGQLFGGPRGIITTNWHEVCPNRRGSDDSSTSSRLKHGEVRRLERL